MALNYNRLVLKNIEFMLSEMNGYCSYMEGYIEQMISGFDKEHPTEKIDALLETDPDYYYWLVDDLAESWQQVAKVYPNSFRSALFGQIYSGLESKLVSLCELHRTKKFTGKVLTGDGSTIEKTRRYLIRYGDIDLSDLHEDFDYFDQIRVVRNCIMHNNGEIKSANKEWDKAYGLVKMSKGYIVFDTDPEEIQEDGKPLYKSRPSFKFRFLFPGTEMNIFFIAATGGFFKRLLEKDLL